MQWTNPALLSKLLSDVRESKESNFYRSLYEKQGIGLNGFAAKHFSELPLLTRKDLVDTPVRERLYVPQREVRFVAFTSGTSSKIPLIVPVAKIDNYFFEPSLGVEVNRPLIIHPPMMKSFGITFVQQCEQAARPLSPLFGDVQNLSNSALLASQFLCDSIYSIPTVLSLFLPQMQQYRIQKNFKLIVLSSETFTKARRQELKEAFPNALIGNVYGSTELGQLPFFPCKRMMEEELNHFHVLTDALAAVELVDGELVFSYGLNRATPLIRYKTGDYFEEVPGGCSCGVPGPVLKWSHRTDGDRLRLNGVEFDVEEVDRAFSAYPHIANARYQIHFDPVQGSSAIAMRVEIADASLAGTSRADDLSQFIRIELPKQWRISSTATLETAIDRGLVAAFTVVVVKELPNTGTKVKRFISHVA